MQKRPRVVVNVGASVDGKVALTRNALLMHQPSSELWGSMTPEAPDSVAIDVIEVVRQQYGCNAVLEGSGSLVSEEEIPAQLPTYDGDPIGLYEDFLPAEVIEQRTPAHMWFTVVDSRGRVRWTERHENWDALVLVAQSTPADYLGYLRRERICYLVVGEERVDLSRAVAAMGTELGITCILSAAGGGLNGALLRADLIDELHLTLAPALVGGLGTPSVMDGSPLAVGEPPTRLELLSAQTDAAGAVRLHYAVRRS
ncbi:riboflavin biosynthesis pyrimidine reductase [Kribbella sp. VKM Ac-2569]|uniref:dihydrofolate reductase family protein n=1 Tax=Kribbella sp. VKM Ac-2569 TaxID=2512220 RepID=UPI0010E0FF4D|nr:dihydrofolate reductase family protein [Kribbella sp. VKM Ac-2569]RZT14751.1 riboflavin biosynthesis pyrimidine reductase [Kribbella sp. VKM Ac-2569]